MGVSTLQLAGLTTSDAEGCVSTERALQRNLPTAGEDMRGAATSPWTDQKRSHGEDAMVSGQRLCGNPESALSKMKRKT